MPNNTDDDGWETIHTGYESYRSRAIVVGTFLGLQRDSIGRITVKEWESLEWPSGSLYYGRRDARPAKSGGWGGRKATEDQVNSLPMVRDRYREPTEACERCGVIAHLHWHHWAPKSMFTDAESWPKSALCPACHAEWHEIVTPQLVKYRRPA